MRLYELGDETLRLVRELLVLKDSATCLQIMQNLPSYTEGLY
jgi:hypothetical protein